MVLSNMRLHEKPIITTYPTGVGATVRTRYGVMILVMILSSISCAPQDEPLTTVGEKLVGDWQHKHAELRANTVSWFRFARDGSYATGSWTDLDAATAAILQKKLEEAEKSNPPPMLLDGNRGHFVGQKGRWKLSGNELTLQFQAHNGKDFVVTYQVTKCDDFDLEMESSQVKAAGLDGVQRFRRQPLPAMP